MDRKTNEIIVNILFNANYLARYNIDRSIGCKATNSTKNPHNFNMYSVRTQDRFCTSSYPQTFRTLFVDKWRRPIETKSKIYTHILQEWWQCILWTKSYFNLNTNIRRAKIQLTGQNSTPHTQLLLLLNYAQ